MTSGSALLLLLIIGTTLGSGSTSCRLPRLANFFCFGSSEAGNNALFLDLGGDFLVAGLLGLAGPFLVGDGLGELLADLEEEDVLDDVALGELAGLVGGSAGVMFSWSSSSREACSLSRAALVLPLPADPDPLPVRVPGPWTM